MSILLIECIYVEIAYVRYGSIESTSTRGARYIIIYIVYCYINVNTIVLLLMTFYYFVLSFISLNTTFLFIFQYLPNYMIGEELFIFMEDNIFGIQVITF